MAVNEKIVYAADWTSHGRNLFRPGEQMTGRVDPEVLRHAQAAGLTTDSHAAAERARTAESARQADVARQIAERSEKREHGER